MRERERKWENLLESEHLVFVDEDGHKIIMFKFKQRNYALVIITRFSWLSIRVEAGFHVKRVTP
jgi:hypothetical protein